MVRPRRGRGFTQRVGQKDHEKGRRKNAGSAKPGKFLKKKDGKEDLLPAKNCARGSGSHRKLIRIQKGGEKGKLDGRWGAK